jgi:alpha-D-xyloside xylohydrolase
LKDHPHRILNHPVDVSRDFAAMQHTYFMGQRVAKMDTAKGRGTLSFRRHLYTVRTAFGQVGMTFWPAEPYEFPAEYGTGVTSHPFEVTFLGPRTLRLRMSSTATMPPPERTLMLARDPKPGKPWKVARSSKATTYTGPHGSLTVTHDPWHFELRDRDGKLLTSTLQTSDNRCLRNSDPIPFCFMRDADDRSRRFAATFSLSPDEGIYGCGESFTRLDKRGQKVVLWTYDAHGVQTDGMYKPVPFFLSSRGYGMFLHTTAPATFDFGHSCDGATTLFTGDDHLDLFVFLGGPKEVLSAYTEVTGKSPMPPPWTFGLWMSRCTYKSEPETRAVAKRLRENRIPCDVIHLDTGWFETDWRCNYEFSKSRFRDPRRMIRDLAKQGFQISLWQLSYFNPNNSLFREMAEKGLVVRDAKGGLPTEDAVLDFSNPRAVKWYQGKLAGLLRMGVGAIKVDFGEAAPLHGQYASGRTGFYEHNYYPLRYNKAAADVTRQVTGGNIIWARSAWAGSQRYPIHWGGDAEVTDSAMAATLRGGLSFGLSGFSFWSHDIGGFVRKTPRDLYRRWMPFGMLTSHSRCHGAGEKEPWTYDPAFMDEFRRSAELKYRLMPYVLAQARDCSEKGHPMVRPLFFEFPADRTSWTIEDEYLFGRDLLVAPLMEDVEARDVYLPPGIWTDHQTGAVYEGGRWHRVKAGAVPCVVMVRDNAVIPQLALAQSTAEMDWGKVELHVFGAGTRAEGLVYFPREGKLRRVVMDHHGHFWKLRKGSLPAKVRYTIQGA